MATECSPEIRAAILSRISAVKEKMASACQTAQRSMDEITLMAVTKTVPPEQVNVAVEAGITLLGENRVQEYHSKCGDYDKRAEVQFIGHLQTNKVRQIVGKVSLIHSVDSLHLLQEVQKIAAQQALVQPILLEVNIGGEASKSGVAPQELPALLEAALASPNVEARGLMTIPPPFAAQAEAEECFSRMQELYETMRKTAPQLGILSMGMSGDFDTAIRYGATLIRLGSALFGARVYPPKTQETQ